MDSYNRPRILALRLSVFSVSVVRYEKREARDAIRVSREGDNLLLSGTLIIIVFHKLLFMLFIV